MEDRNRPQHSNRERPAEGRGYGKPFSGQKRPWPGDEGGGRGPPGRGYDRRDGDMPPPGSRYDAQGPPRGYGGSAPRGYRGPPPTYDAHRSDSHHHHRSTDRGDYYRHDNNTAAAALNGDYRDDRRSRSPGARFERSWSASREPRDARDREPRDRSAHAPPPYSSSGRDRHHDDGVSPPYHRSHSSKDHPSGTASKPPAANGHHTHHKSDHPRHHSASRRDSDVSGHKDKARRSSLESGEHRKGGGTGGRDKEERSRGVSKEEDQRRTSPAAVPLVAPPPLEDFSPVSSAELADDHVNGVVSHGEEVPQAVDSSFKNSKEAVKDKQPTTTAEKRKRDTDNEPLPTTLAAATPKAATQPLSPTAAKANGNGLLVDVKSNKEGSPAVAVVAVVGDQSPHSPLDQQHPTADGSPSPRQPGGDIEDGEEKVVAAGEKEQQPSAKTELSSSKAVLRRIQQVDEEMSTLDASVKDLALTVKRCELAEGKAAKALAKLEEVPAPQPPSFDPHSISDVPLSSDEEEEQQDEDAMEVDGGGGKTSAGNKGGGPKKRGRPAKSEKQQQQQQRSATLEATKRQQSIETAAAEAAKMKPNRRRLAEMLGRQISGWTQPTAEELLLQAKTTALQTHARFVHLLPEELLEPVVVAVAVYGSTQEAAVVKQQQQEDKGPVVALENGNGDVEAMQIDGGLNADNKDNKNDSKSVDNDKLPTANGGSSEIVMVPKTGGVPEALAAVTAKLKAAVAEPVPSGITAVITREFEALLSRQVISAVDYRIQYDRYKKSVLSRQQSTAELRRNASTLSRDREMPMSPNSRSGRGRNADVVRSDYEEKQAIATLGLMELVKHMTKLPNMVLPSARQARWVSQYIDRNRLIEDPIAEDQLRQFTRPFTAEERQIFAERYLQHHKDFHRIAKDLPGRSYQEVVALYYAIQKSDEFEATRKKYSMRKRREKAESAANQRNAGLRGMGIAAYQPPPGAALPTDQQQQQQDPLPRRASSGTLSHQQTQQHQLHGAVSAAAIGAAAVPSGSAGGRPGRPARSKSTPALPVNPEPPTEYVQRKRTTTRKPARTATLETCASMLPTAEELAFLDFRQTSIAITIDVVSGGGVAGGGGGDGGSDRWADDGGNESMEDLDDDEEFKLTAAPAVGRPARGRGRPRKDRSGALGGGGNGSNVRGGGGSGVDVAFDAIFCEAVRLYGRDMSAISRHVGGGKTAAAVRLYFNRHSQRLGLHAIAVQHDQQQQQQQLGSGSMEIDGSGDFGAILHRATSSVDVEAAVAASAVLWEPVGVALNTALEALNQQQEQQQPADGAGDGDNVATGEVVKAEEEPPAAVAASTEDADKKEAASMAVEPTDNGDNAAVPMAVDTKDIVEAPATVLSFSSVVHAVVSALATVPVTELQRLSALLTTISTAEGASTLQALLLALDTSTTTTVVEPTAATATTEAPPQTQSASQMMPNDEAIQTALPLLASLLQQLSTSAAGLAVAIGGNGGGRGGGRGRRPGATIWSEEEKEAFIACYKVHGRDWAQLEAAIPTKTPTQIKNYFQNYRTKLGLTKMKVPGVQGTGATRGRKRKAVNTPNAPHIKITPRTTTTAANTVAGLAPSKLGAGGPLGSTVVSAAGIGATGGSNVGPAEAIQMQMQQQAALLQALQQPGAAAMAASAGLVAPEQVAAFQQVMALQQLQQLQHQVQMQHLAAQSQMVSALGAALPMLAAAAQGNTNPVLAAQLAQLPIHHPPSAPPPQLQQLLALSTQSLLQTQQQQHQQQQQGRPPSTIVPTAIGNNGGSTTEPGTAVVEAGQDALAQQGPQQQQQQQEHVVAVVEEDTVQAMPPIATTDTVGIDKDTDPVVKVDTTTAAGGVGGDVDGDVQLQTAMTNDESITLEEGIGDLPPLTAVGDDGDGNGGNA